jgi:hypothetical protein
LKFATASLVSVGDNTPEKSGKTIQVSMQMQRVTRWVYEKIAQGVAQN